MSIKTFTADSVLTASDTNTYLANSGLVYVKSQTVGTAVSSVTVSGAFSTDFDNYRIVIGGGTASTAANMTMGLGSSVTGYYGLLQYGTYAGSGYTAATNNNSTQWDFVGYCNTNYVGAAFDLINPFTTNWTQILNAGWTPSTASGTFQGIHQVATSYTSFTIASVAALTGGTISVYGYRKA